MLTFELDFGIALALADREWPSVVQVRADTQKPEHIFAQVLSALQCMTVELEQGALVTVHSTRTRLRLLSMKNRRQTIFVADVQ